MKEVYIHGFKCAPHSIDGYFSCHFFLTSQVTLGLQVLGSYVCAPIWMHIYLQFIILSSWFVSEKSNNILTFEIIIF